MRWARERNDFDHCGLYDPPGYVRPDPDGIYVEDGRGWRGAIGGATDRLCFDIPPWGPPYFGGFLPNSLIFSAPNSPLPQNPTEEGGENETTAQTKGLRGTPRNATERYGT